MARPKDGRPKPGINDEEDNSIDFIEEIREFQEFRRKYLPAIRADLSAGMTPKQLREKYAALAQASEIMELLNPDKRALAAKNILDRHEGKAKEVVETTHKFQNMKEEQLDAVLKSKLQSLKDTDEDTGTH